VIRSHELLTPLVWIEHWPEESTDGGEETFKLVVFSSYEFVERALYLGETRAWIGDATWKRLDRPTVELLVGKKGIGNWLPRAELLLWSQEVDYGLYTDSYHGDEDQSPGHGLVASVQVATHGKEYGSQGEQKHS
jgi:hypothetical protein